MGVGAGGAALPTNGSSAGSGLPAGDPGSSSSPGWPLIAPAGSAGETVSAGWETVGSGWLVHAAASVRNAVAERIKIEVCRIHGRRRVNPEICNMATVPFNGLACMNRFSAAG